MSQKHPSFNEPEDHEIVWRYMDFTKYASLLERKSLFFSNFDLLRKNDKREGTINKIMEKKINDPIMTSLSRLVLARAAVNCWHINPDESTAMWSIYTENNMGIAIKCTYKDLKDSFIDNDPTDEKKWVLFGKANYTHQDDPIIEGSETGNTLDFTLWKDPSYIHENELRAVTLQSDMGEDKYSGIYRKVNLDKLIQNIIVAPDAPIWFYELVQSLGKSHNLYEKVKHSRLSKYTRASIYDSEKIPWTCPECGKKQETILNPLPSTRPNSQVYGFILHDKCSACKRIIFHSITGNPKLKIYYEDD